MSELVTFIQVSKMQRLMWENQMGKIIFKGGKSYLISSL